MLSSTCQHRTTCTRRFPWHSCTLQRDTRCKQIEHFQCIQHCIHNRSMIARHLTKRRPLGRPDTGRPQPGNIQHCRSKTWRQDQTWRSWNTECIHLLPEENTGRPRTTRTETQKWLQCWTMPSLQHNLGTLWRRNCWSTCPPRTPSNPNQNLDPVIQKTFRLGIEHRKMPPLQNTCQHRKAYKHFVIRRLCLRSRSLRCIRNTTYPWLSRRNMYLPRMRCMHPSHASSCTCLPRTPRTPRRLALYNQHCTGILHCQMHCLNWLGTLRTLSTRELSMCRPSSPCTRPSQESPCTCPPSMPRKPRRPALSIPPCTNTGSPRRCPKASRKTLGTSDNQCCRARRSMSPLGSPRTYTR